MNKILSFGMFVACCGQVFAMQCNQKTEKVSHSDSETQNIQKEIIRTPRGGSEGENAATSKKEWLSSGFKKRLEEVRRSFSKSNSDDDCLAVIQADKFLIAKNAKSLEEIEKLENQASETNSIEEVYDINLQDVGDFFDQTRFLDLSQEIPQKFVCLGS